jgi:holo-[acyl-carrier protein] synthase
MFVRVGTDVMSIAEVAESLERFGERYATRLFTSHEIDSCGGVSVLAAPGLAARFAAKEAVIKLLRPVDTVPRWHSIEIRREAGGAVGVHLSAECAELAAQQGIASVELSMSHGAGIGTATAVALGNAEHFSADKTSDTSSTPHPQRG